MLTRPHRSVPSVGAPAGRRVVAAALVLALALAGLLGATLAGAPAASAAGACSGPLPAGQIRVVLVVDPGETGPRGPMATCLVVAAGTSGSKILAQRASQLGMPSPRYTGSGLLCGLDGFPASGCPVNNGGTYAYWAYFNASGGSWSFGHDNPFVRRMVDGEIMGWRYTTGSSDGQAPTPRLAPSSSFFPPLTPATTAPPVTAPPTGGGGTGAAGGAGGPSAPAGSGGGGSDPAAIPDLSGLADTSTGAADGSTTSTDAADASESDGVGGDDQDGRDSQDDAEAEELASAPASSSGTDSGRWVGVAVAVAAGGALTIGAVGRNRSRGRARSGS